MSAEREKNDGGLSLTTLLIASAASMAAAIFIHKFWSGGAILGAAITPIIVAVVSESLKKPTQRVTAIREQRRQATVDGPRVSVPPRTAPEPERDRDREDRFGIWEADRTPPWHRLNRRHLQIALVTGLLAFAVGAFALTGAELVFGGSASGDRRTTVFGGEDRKDRDSERGGTTTTDPQETTPDETETAPATPAPETTPTTPPKTTPVPGEEAAPQTPAPAPGETAPAPAPEQPGAEQAPAE